MKLSIRKTRAGVLRIRIRMRIRMWMRMRMRMRKTSKVGLRIAPMLTPLKRGGLRVLVRQKEDGLVRSTLQAAHLEAAHQQAGG